jgi:transposase
VRLYTLQFVVEYKCEREGTQFVAVSLRGTTKECASCGVLIEKPLWSASILVRRVGLKRTETQMGIEYSVSRV